HRAKDALEADAGPPAERDPDDAGPTLHVAEGDLPDATLDAAVGGVVAVVAHHEQAALLDHEGQVARKPGVAALQDRVPHAAQVLDVLAGRHLDVGIGVLGVLGIGELADGLALLLD